MRNLFAIAFLLSCSIQADAAITIDDFSVGSLDVTLTESQQYATTTQTGLPATSVIGGIRQHHGTFNTPVSAGSEARFVIDTNDGTFRLTTNVGFEGSRLEYGYGPGLMLGPALDLDLTAFNAFRIDVLSSAKPAPISLTLKSGVDENLNTNSLHKNSFHRFTLPTSAVRHSVRIPFTSFANRVDFSDIDYINLTGGAPNDFDLILDGIFVVPEPSTLALLLMSIAATVGRRR